ncbi:MAG: CDF family Co(II)/Ni(II) efflux transporter DmeF [Aestuariivirga sp.]
MKSEHHFELAHDHRRWQHTHNYAYGHEGESERRTFWVMLLTAAMCIVEIGAGWLFNSVALFADGWHMSTHAMALGIGFFAYRYARLQAKNSQFSFGTGKVHALGSYSSALILAFVALFVLVDSVWSMFGAETISYNQAIPVAFIGLAVNLLSIKLLHVGHSHDDGDNHGHERDHNMKAAFAHVVVDAMTSVLAILALLGGKYLNWTLLDPLVGVIGAVIIAQWAWALLKTAMQMLLDRQPSQELLKDIRERIQKDGDSEVSDLHVWQIAPGRNAAIVSIVTHEQRQTAEFKDRLMGLGLAHVTVELNQCAK